MDIKGKVNSYTICYKIRNIFTNNCYHQLECKSRPPDKKLVDAATVKYEYERPINSLLSNTYGVTLSPHEFDCSSLVAVARALTTQELNHIGRKYYETLNSVILNEEDSNIKFNLLAIPLKTNFKDYTYAGVNSFTLQVTSLLILTDYVDKERIEIIRKNLYMNTKSTITTVSHQLLELLPSTADCENKILPAQCRENYLTLKISNVQYLEYEEFLLCIENVIHISNISSIFYYQMLSRTAITYVIILKDPEKKVTSLVAPKLDKYAFTVKRIILEYEWLKPLSSINNIFTLQPSKHKVVTASTTNNFKLNKK